MRYREHYDVLVVGGGHAGTEAAYAAARTGARTLLLTQSLEALGQMSCNPSIGGIGKGHLVKEVDAFGGLMARCADRSGIQFRILNRSKGPAVQATRAQIDRVLYRSAVRQALEACLQLDLFQQQVSALRIESGRVVGVTTAIGIEIEAKSVVLTAGTFLNGKIHVGMENHSGGRAGDPASVALADQLEGPYAPTGTPQDRDATALRRPDDRLRASGSAGRGPRPGARILFPWLRRRAPRAAPVLDNPYDATHARPDSRGA